MKLDVFFFISKKIILKRTSWKHKANQRTERDTNKEKQKQNKNTNGANKN